MWRRARRAGGKTEMQKLKERYFLHAQLHARRSFVYEIDLIERCCKRGRVGELRIQTRRRWGPEKRGSQLTTLLKTTISETPSSLSLHRQRPALSLPEEVLTHAFQFI
jgi:hypothetical protein